MGGRARQGTAGALGPGSVPTALNSLGGRAGCGIGRGWGRSECGAVGAWWPWWEELVDLGPRGGLRPGQWAPRGCGVGHRWRAGFAGLAEGVGDLAASQVVELPVLWSEAAPLQTVRPHPAQVVPRKVPGPSPPRRSGWPASPAADSRAGSSPGHGARLQDAVADGQVGSDELARPRQPPRFQTEMERGLLARPRSTRLSVWPGASDAHRVPAPWRVWEGWRAS